MEFNESKKVGDIFENYILNFIQKKYPLSFIDDKGKKFSDWDIFVPEKDFGIEVKSDYKSNFTNNIVIEVEMNNKLSALSLTKAKYWVIIDGIRLMWIKPIEIYRFIDQNKYQRTTILGDGDNNTKMVYLVSRDKLVLHIFNNLKNDDGWLTYIPTNDSIHFNTLHNLNQLI